MDHNLATANGDWGRGHAAAQPRPGRVDLRQEISIKSLSWAKMGRPSVSTMSVEKRRRLAHQVLFSNVNDAMTVFPGRQLVALKNELSRHVNESRGNKPLPPG